MKNNTLLYFISLIFLAICIFFLVEYSDSGRMSTIAGVLCAVGLALNLFVFFRKKESD